MGILNFFKKNKGLQYREWQYIVLGQHVNEIYPKEILLKLSNDFIDTRRDLIDSCLNIINKTNSINIFFSRFDLLIENLTELSLLEPYITFKEPAPSQHMKNLLLAKDTYTKGMLSRAWNNTKLQVLSFKTLEAKANKLNAFFSAAYLNQSKMGEESLRYLAELNLSSSSILNNHNEITSSIDFNEAKEAELLDNLKKSKNAVDRHFAYINLQDFYYKYRNLDNIFVDKCIQYCTEDINSLDSLREDYVNEQIEIQLNIMKYVYDEDTIKDRISELKKTGFDGSIPAFKRLAIIYEKQGKYERALDICNHAIEYGQVNDGTKDGFKGRIEKLQNKI